MIINGLKFEKLQLLFISMHTRRYIHVLFYLSECSQEKKTSPNMFNLIQNSSKLNVYDTETL